MRVWRMECPDTREGPWTAGRTDGWRSVEGDGGHHPSNGPGVIPDCFATGGEYIPLETRNRLMEGRVCACKSVRQLTLWFHAPHIWELANDGYVLAEYEVDETAVGRGSQQCAVTQSEMIHINDHPPTLALI